MEEKKVDFSLSKGVTGGTDDDSDDIDKLFESDEEIKDSLKKLMNLPMEFMEDSSDDESESESEPAPTSQVEEKSRGDSVEKQMEAMFVEDRHGKSSTGEPSKEMEFESISDIELDGPESGECDTSDGELPESPKVVVTLPDTPVVVIDSAAEVESDDDLKIEYHNRSDEYCNNVSQKISVSPKPEREMIIEKTVEVESPPIIKQNPDKDIIKNKDKSVENSKSKEKKIKYRDISPEEERKKKETKMKKYLGKCLEYFLELSKKKEDKESHNGLKSETKKRYVQPSLVQSVVEKAVKDNNTPHRSGSGRSEQVTLITRSYSLEELSEVTELKKHKPTSVDKERKNKSDKKSKKKSKEDKYRYKKYLQYLESGLGNGNIENLELEKNKCKTKRKRKKSRSASSEKSKENECRSTILTFPDFCKSRELISPDIDLIEEPTVIYDNSVNNKDRTLSTDSKATTSNARNEQVDPLDDGKELFVTISDLVEQDKIQNKEKDLEEDNDGIESIVKTDPELKSISVFTSVLFKGSTDSNGIPFLQGNPPSPISKEALPKRKTSFNAPEEPDEIYDWNDDDLSNISLSSLSPSRSPAPKLHNKALLKFLENQKLSAPNETVKKAPKNIKYPSRSRSKSPRKEKSKRKKKHHSKSISRSPSPSWIKTSLVHKKRVSPSSHLKDRWRDYRSPPHRKRDHYEAHRSSYRSRTRPCHNRRSRSSSVERPQPRRHRSPPPTTMGADKRRLLREEHERALASLRATIRKPVMATSLQFLPARDNFRDNYEPVIMNEDSSSAPSILEENAVPDLPPLPPGLPPEPPPGPPPPLPGTEDMTVVTTYTSFVPLPTTRHPFINPDISQMPTFNNWGLNHGGDMQHHVYPPHVMNSYNSLPSQQQFPFLNQPPTFQIPLPPPCHPHYQMQNQPSPQNINLIGVCQEIKNIKSGPVLTVENKESTECDKPYNLNKPKLSHQSDIGNKCKHKGPNNLTIQEAIDSVRMCLKSCETFKNKDPRLVTSECPSNTTCTPVEQTTNFKQDSVSSTSMGAHLDKSNDKAKTDTYNEKHSNIEGIVLKLKDTIGSTADNYLNVSETTLKACCTNENPNSSGINQNQGVNTCTLTNKTKGRNKTGDEPPFNCSDDPSKNCDKGCTSKPKNDDVGPPDVSGEEIFRINMEVRNLFSFILAHNIERKRLTPTVSSINEKKVENIYKRSVVKKIIPILSIQTTFDRDKILLNELNTRVDKHVHESLIPAINEKICKSPNCPDTVVKERNVEKSNANYMKKDKEETDISDKSETKVDILNKNKDLTVTYTERSSEESKLVYESMLEKTIMKESRDIPVHKNPITDTKLSVLNNAHVTCETSISNVKEDDNLFKPTVSKNKKCVGNKQIKSEPLSESTSDNQTNNNSCDVVKCVKQEPNKTTEQTSQSTEESLEVKDLSKLIVENILPDTTVVNKTISDRSVNPALSIPTKGELKRFPTAEIYESHVENSPFSESKNRKDSTPNEAVKEIEDDLKSLEKNSTHISCSPNDIVKSILLDFEENSSTELNLCEEIKDSKDREGSICCTHVVKWNEIEKTSSDIVLENTFHLGNNSSILTTNIQESNTNDPLVQSTNLFKSKFREREKQINTEFTQSTIKSRITDNASGAKIVLKDCKPNKKLLNILTELSSSEFCIEDFRNDLNKGPIMKYQASYKQTKGGTLTSQKTKSNPCPLSKKSKSYISQNLPACFELPRDSQLILRGFKKLQIKLTQAQPQQGLLPKVEQFSISAERVSEQKRSTKEDIAFLKHDVSNDGVNQTGGNRKKVSFNTIDKMCDKTDGVPSTELGRTQSDHKNDISNIVGLGNSFKEIFEASESTKAQEDFNNQSIFIQPNVIREQTFNVDITSRMPISGPENNINLYYEGITNTLSSFHSTPFVVQQKRKTVSLTILTREDIPVAKILVSKNVPAIRFNKFVNQKHNDSLEDKSTSDRNLKENEGSPALRNNNSRKSEGNEIDKNDSVVLDRELADLAKGCLDSNISAGTDDDSSVDGDVGLERKTLLLQSTSSQAKLSSPENIKLRFSKKHKTININDELNNKEVSICNKFISKINESPNCPNENAHEVFLRHTNIEHDGNYELTLNSSYCIVDNATDLKNYECNKKEEDNTLVLVAQACIGKRSETQNKLSQIYCNNSNDLRKNKNISVKRSDLENTIEKHQVTEGNHSFPEKEEVEQIKKVPNSTNDSYLEQELGMCGQGQMKYDNKNVHIVKGVGGVDAFKDFNHVINSKTNHDKLNDGLSEKFLQGQQNSNETSKLRRVRKRKHNTSNSETNEIVGTTSELINSTPNEITGREDENKVRNNSLGDSIKSLDLDLILGMTQTKELKSNNEEIYKQNINEVILHNDYETVNIDSAKIKNQHKKEPNKHVDNFSLDNNVVNISLEKSELGKDLTKKEETYNLPLYIKPEDRKVVEKLEADSSTTFELSQPKHLTNITLIKNPFSKSKPKSTTAKISTKTGTETELKSQTINKNKLSKTNPVIHCKEENCFEDISCTIRPGKNIEIDDGNFKNNVASRTSSPDSNVEPLININNKDLLDKSGVLKPTGVLENKIEADEVKASTEIENMYRFIEGIAKSCSITSKSTGQSNWQTSNISTTTNRSSNPSKDSSTPNTNNNPEDDYNPSNKMTDINKTFDGNELIGLDDTSQNSCNPKLKEAFGKKRDKAEVDAEIKRRLAEIDELEKIGQSPNTFSESDKVGNRTRSKTCIVSKIKNISGESGENHSNIARFSGGDLNTTSDYIEHTNSSTRLKTTTNIGLECTTEEPSTTLKEEEPPIKKCANGADSKKEILKEISVSECILAKIPIITKITIDNVNTNEQQEFNEKRDSELNDLSEAFNTSEKHSGNQSYNNCSTTPDNNSSKHLRKHKWSRSKKSTQGILKKSKQKTMPQLNQSVISQQLQSDKRDMISVYQFKESDSDVVPIQQLLTRSTRNKLGRLKTKEVNIVNNNNKLHTFPRSSIETCTSVSETPITKDIHNKVVDPEPDSSTTHLIESNLESDISIITSSGITKSQAYDHISEESILSDLSHDSNLVEPSNLGVFRKPIRKSWMNKKRRRRPLLRRGMGSSGSFASSVNDKNNENSNGQSEETVSSSVSQLKPKIKVKRKRKTGMDLLMDDSMLSVTRDFPMSPNPYIFPSFCKEISILDNKISGNERCVTENSSKISNIEIIPKPDPLSQKLRLLEKLKNISRKNRKTRQCRTLVCYNEDSLPDSLVESPMDENNITCDDSETLEQVVLEKYTSECEQKTSLNFALTEPNESLNYVSKESPNTSEVKINITSKLLKRKQKVRFSKHQHRNNSRKRKPTQIKTFSDDCTGECININLTNNIDVGSISQNSLDCVNSPPTAENKNNLNCTNNTEIEENEISEFDKLFNNLPKECFKQPKSHDARFDLSTTFSAYDDKSSDCSNDCYVAFPSPLHTDSDNENVISFENKSNFDSKTISLLSNTNNKSFSGLLEYNKTTLYTNKIVCSISRNRIGKLLPYFGNTSDDDNIDEDIPLSMKIAKIEKTETSVCPSPKQEDLNQDIHLSESTQTKLHKKRGRKPKGHFSKPPVLNSERKVTRRSALLLEDDIAMEGTAPQRKSTRRAKSILALPKQTTEPAVICNLDLNDKGNSSKVENITNALLHSECKFDPAPPVKRRGRPPKKSKSNHKQHVINSLSKIDQAKKVIINSLDECKVPTSLSSNQVRGFDTNEKDLFIPHCCDKNPTNALVKSKVYSENFDLSSENIGSSLECTRLELSDLDSAIQKSVALKRNKVTHFKRYSKRKQIAIKLEQSCEGINCISPQTTISIELRHNQEHLLPKDTPVKRTSKRNKQAQLNKRNLSKKTHVSVNEDSTEGLPASIDVAGSFLSLVSTRLRSQKLDSVFLETTNQAIPIQSQIQTNENNETNDLFSTISEGNKLLDEITTVPKLDSTFPKGCNNEGTTHPNASQLQQNAFLANSINGESFNLQEVDETKTEEEVKVPKKRGRKRKYKLHVQQTCDRAPLKTGVDSECDVGIEGNVSLVKEDMETHVDISQHDLLTPIVDSSKGNLKQDTIETNFVKSSQVLQSKKRKRNAKERTVNCFPTKESENNTNCLRNEKELNKSVLDEHVLKKQRFECTGNLESGGQAMISEEIANAAMDKGTEKSNGSERDNQACTESTSEGNPSSGAYNTNQAFLWNKISGFLNKTTRSVGTQVKVKNLTLKGFETTEPEVSLQSALTLPLVIKTLFEELKTLDSSFSNS